MVLFLDTSSKDFFICLFDNDKIIDSLKIENIITHSNFIDEKVKDFLIKNNINITDIDYFAVSVGPGSYTGIRVGYAFILGICEAIDKKILTINLLESMKYYIESNILDNNYIVFPLINANNNNVYTIINENKVKTNIDDLKSEIINNNEYKNIIFISTDNDLKDKFVDIKNAKFEYIEDIGKISLKFINKKLVNNEFSNSYIYKIDYLDQ